MFIYMFFYFDYKELLMIVVFLKVCYCYWLLIYIDKDG